jgi:ribosomal protein S27AE
MTKRKKATLTEVEDAAWVEKFSFYVDEGKSDAEADRITWKEMQDEYPRLKAFDGCKPGVAKAKRATCPRCGSASLRDNKNGSYRCRSCGYSSVVSL